MKFLPYFFLIIILSCATGKNKTKSSSPTLFAVSWFQNSGEAKALFYQGYYVATEELKKIVQVNKKAKTDRRPLAVVLDLDETVLDNSPYNATLIQKGGSFPTGWSEWCAAAHAKALPGAKAFLDYAHQNKVEIFYVSNREESAKESTFKNLLNLQIPVKLENMLLKQKSSGKEDRRLTIAQRFNIALLIGDNLNDFSHKFEKLGAIDRKKTVEQSSAEFGPKYIILPNPMYGDWEGSIYQYDWKLPETEKHSLHEKQLETF